MISEQNYLVMHQELRCLKKGLNELYTSVITQTRCNQGTEHYSKRKRAAIDAAKLVSTAATEVPSFFAILIH